MKNIRNDSQIVSDHNAGENRFTQFEVDTSEKNVYEDSKDMPVETVISRRMSIRQFDLNVAVPWESVSKVLWAAYGHSLYTRTVPSLSAYPVIIYVCNETAAYRFVPENQSLTLWKEGDYRGLGKGGGWSYDAPIQLYIVLDTNISGVRGRDVLWGNAESGCAIQNIYLMANALNLGTVNTYPNRTDIQQGLGLPVKEEVLYKMPLGYPLPPYANYQNLMPTFRPSSSELPEIQDSNVSLGEALDSIFSSHDWSNNPVTCQELSQILWAGYGYSYYEDTAASPPTRHRTVPSAHNYYPMKVYGANSSGVYEYLPEKHNLTAIVTEDKRQSIAQASGNAWASSAPLIIAVAYVEDSRPWIGGEETYVEVGLIAQNVYLECGAWGLVADWGRADMDEEAMREALGLIGETHLHPASVITVGHRSTSFGLNIESTQGGLTDPPPGVYNYQNGSSVNVTAIPGSGYSFDHWIMDGENSTENPTTVIMNANHTLKAAFVDNIPPSIGIPVQNPPENVLANQNVTVVVNVTDSGSGVNNVTLMYTVNNGTTWIPLIMVGVSANIHQATIPGRENGVWVTYKIVAYDNNSNSAISDNDGHFYVYHIVPEFSIWSPIFLTFLILTSAMTVYKRKSLIKHKKAPTRIQSRAQSKNENSRTRRKQDRRSEPVERTNIEFLELFNWRAA